MTQAAFIDQITGQTVVMNDSQGNGQLLLNVLLEIRLTNTILAAMASGTPFNEDINILRADLAADPSFIVQR